ncbi:MAG: hypothetical protein AB2799_21590 [Candidatus Thiodiazotropha sp.]
MARLPDETVTRIKREVSLVRLAEARGFELKPHGVLSACPPNRHSPKTAPNMTHSRLFFRLFPKPSLNYVRSIAFFTPI